MPSIIVTGLATAERFAKGGWQVAIIARVPALIDGDAKDRAIDTRSEFFTSYHRDLLKKTPTGGFLSLGAVAGLGLSRRFTRLWR